MLIPYEKGVAEKLKRVASTCRFTTRTKQKDKMETSGVVYEVDCNNCLKNYTYETGRKLKEWMKEHKDDGEKSWKDKMITGLPEHMRTTGHSPAWDDIRIIYRENNWKKRKFKEAARITSHNKEQLLNKKRWKKDNFQTKN